MNKVSTCLTLLIFLPFMIVGVVLLVLGLQAMPPGATEDSVTMVKSVYLMTGAIFLVVTLLLGVGFLAFAMVKRNRTQNLIQNGVQGTARIITVNETGVYINNQPQMEVQMEITLPDMAPYVASKRVVIPMSKLGQVNPDAEIMVLVDPSDPTNQKKIGLLLR